MRTEKRTKMLTKQSMKTDGNWRWHDICYIILLIVLFVMSTFMFYRQSIRYNGGYEADTSLYVNMSVDDHGLRLIKWIYHYLFNVRGDTALIAVYMGAVVVLTALMNYAVFRWYQHWLGIEREKGSRIYAEIASIIMFVTGSMYLPLIHPRFYKGSWCTYAWHSPTQQLMILFAMISLFIFLNIYEEYMERIDPVKWILLMITSTLSVWAKPSFMLVFIPVLIIVFIIELVVHIKEGQTIKRFTRLFIFGMSMVPSGILILFLNKSIFGQGSDNQVAVNTGGLSGLEYNVYIAALCGLLFPAVVMIVNCKRFKELPFQIALGMLIMGIAEWLMFYEEGSRQGAGNFAWGRQFGCYYFFFVAIVVTFENLKDKEFLGGKHNLRACYFSITAIFLAMHILSQTYHLYLMFRGHNYYI